LKRLSKTLLLLSVGTGANRRLSILSGASLHFPYEINFNWVGKTSYVSLIQTPMVYSWLQKIKPLISHSQTSPSNYSLNSALGWSKGTQERSEDSAVYVSRNLETVRNRHKQSCACRGCTSERSIRPWFSLWLNWCNHESGEVQNWDVTVIFC